MSLSHPHLPPSLRRSLPTAHPACRSCPRPAHCRSRPGLTKPMCGTGGTGHCSPAHCRSHETR
eukprot:6387926-Prymnesium_polylepis.1